MKLYIAWQRGIVYFSGAGEEFGIGAFHSEPPHIITNVNLLPFQMVFIKNDLIVEALFEYADVHTRFTALAIDSDLEPAYDRLQGCVRRQGLIGVDNHMHMVGHYLEIIDAKLWVVAGDVAQICLNNSTYRAQGKSIRSNAAEVDVMLCH